jgi:hypothetical protein
MPKQFLRSSELQLHAANRDGAPPFGMIWWR